MAAAAQASNQHQRDGDSWVRPRVDPGVGGCHPGWTQGEWGGSGVDPGVGGPDPRWIQGWGWSGVMGGSRGG